MRFIHEMFKLMPIQLNCDIPVIKIDFIQSIDSNDEIFTERFEQ